MAGEFDQITNALKIAYPPKVIEPMVNEETPFRKQLKKSIPGGGRVTEGIVKFGFNLNPPQNVATIKDSGTLPIPKNRTELQGQLTPVICAGSFQIGWITRRAANTNKAAFNGGELRRRTEETISDLSKNIEQSYLQNWTNATYGGGVKAIAASGTATTFVPNDPERFFGLRENMYVGAKTSAGAWRAYATGATYISDLNLTTLTATITDGAGNGITGLTGTDVIVITNGAGSSADTAYQSDFTSLFGLRGLVDNATYQDDLHGNSRATYPKLNCVVNTAGSLRSITEQILIRTCHEVRARSGKRVTDAWTSPGQAEKYVEFVAPDRRYTVTSKTSPQSMVTGYDEDSLVHVFPGGMFKIQISFDIFPREMYLLSWDTFFHYVAQDMDWMDEGGMLQPAPAASRSGYKASFYAYMGSIENIGCDMPLGNAVIRMLKDPVLGDV